MAFPSLTELGLQRKLAMARAGVSRLVARLSARLRLQSRFEKARAGVSRFVSPNRLSTRLVIFYGGLSALSMFGAAAIVSPILHSMVVHQARTDASASSIVLDRLWRTRGVEMARAVEVASLDFGFRQTLARTDAATIESALDNLRSRLGAGRLLFIPIDGGAFDSQLEQGVPLSASAAATLWQSLDSSEASSGAIEIDRTVFHAAFAPVMAPDLRGWLVIAEPLDARQLQRSAQLIDLPVTVRIARSTGEANTSLQQRANQSLTMTRPIRAIGAANDPGFSLIVSYPLANAFAPYLLPFVAIGLIALASGAVFLVGCIAIARTFTRPIVALTNAAGKLEAGEYGAVAVAGSDEIADLGRVFNSMATKISARERDLRALLTEQSCLHEAAVAASRSKSEFLATMSHELRTPLNAIIGFGEIIREDLARGSLARVDEDASRVLVAARHLLKLINEVLDIAKIDASRLAVQAEDFDVELLVRDAIATMRPVAKAGNVDVSADLENNLGAARTDEFKVKQCLLNLLSNAIKFSAGGVVAITTRRTTLGGVEHLVFEISDTGIGMTEEQLERVFKPFEQGDASTTRKFGGTGLGLSIVQGLVGLLGGTITASSVLGSGSTFTLRLPVDLDAARNNANVSLSSRAA